MSEPKPKPDPDEPVKIDLDPLDALSALLKVDPEAEPVAGEGVTQEAADSTTQPEADATNEG